MALDTRAEFERLNALRRYAILDSPPEGAFDRVTALTADLLEVPIAMVTLVDTDRVWFKSVHGPAGIREVVRGPGLCSAALRHPEVYLVEHASADPRTQEHPLVAGEFGLEFYVGQPLVTHDGHRLGVLCGIDRRPRSVTARQVRHLATLAAIIMDEIELRRSARQISRLSEALADACTDMERRASFDPLTGVLGRAAILDRGARLLERALAGSKGAGVLMLDIDRFKWINDGHGHAAGDAVLKEIAARMAASCRAGDLLGRIGGEEFLALFAEVNAEEVEAIAGRLREAVVRAPVAAGGSILPVTVSGGLLWLGPDDQGTSLAAAMSRADAGLYAAKAAGRDRIVPVPPAPSAGS